MYKDNFLCLCKKQLLKIIVGIKVLKSIAGTAFILYHTIPTFNNPEKEAFKKYCGKRKNAGNNVFYSFIDRNHHFNPFPHNDIFLCPWETSLLKTLWEKEKLLVTSNFSFSHIVFYPFG